MSLDRLITAIAEKKNPTVAGFDPLFDYIPDFIKNECLTGAPDKFAAAAKSVLTFNKALIDALYDIVPAIKPQLAYYEMYGPAGLIAYYDTVRYAKEKGMFVIADGKRNDIGSTMQAYAAAHLGTVELYGEKCEPFGADALTVNGYLGSDGITPLLAVCKENDKGIFVLCKTSNPSSGEVQDQKIGDEPIYERMGELCEKWGEGAIGAYGYSAVGAVVGATYPEQLHVLREKMPHTFFLVPGYGAQGGGAADVAAAFDSQGRGAVVNASRSIICAWKKEGCPPEDFAGAARREAIRMRDDIMQAIGR